MVALRGIISASIREINSHLKDVPGGIPKSDLLGVTVARILLITSLGILIMIKNVEA